MANLMIYGSGYSRPYMTDAAEVGSATAGNWFPSSVDFQVTAMRSGMASGASSLADMIYKPQDVSHGSTKLLLKCFITNYLVWYAREDSNL
jgi:hypothetical protein